MRKGWEIKNLGEVVEVLDNLRKPITKKHRVEGIYPYYGATGILSYVHDYIFDERLILIGEDGAKWKSGDNTAFIAEGKYWVNNHAHVLDGISEEFLRYIELSINATDLKPYVTGTAQPKMNQAKMNSIPIALPPLAEQQRIVAKVDELMAICDQLEAQITVTEQDSRRFLESVLADALAPGIECNHH